MGQGDAFGGPVKGFHRCQNFLPHPEPLVWMADPGGGNVLRGQQGHDAPADVHKGSEGLRPYHPACHHGAGLQLPEHFLHGGLLGFPAGKHRLGRALGVGGDSIHCEAHCLANP